MQTGFIKNHFKILIPLLFARENLAATLKNFHCIKRALPVKRELSCPFLLEWNIIKNATDRIGLTKHPLNLRMLRERNEVDMIEKHDMRLFPY